MFPKPFKKRKKKKQRLRDRERKVEKKHKKERKKERKIDFVFLPIVASPADVLTDSIVTSVQKISLTFSNFLRKFSKNLINNVIVHPVQVAEWSKTPVFSNSCKESLPLRTQV